MDIQVFVGKFFQPDRVLESFHDKMLSENQQRLKQTTSMGQTDLWMASLDSVVYTIKALSPPISFQSLWGLSSANPHPSIPNPSAGPTFSCVLVKPDSQGPLDVHSCLCLSIVSLNASSCHVCLPHEASGSQGTPLSCASHLALGSPCRTLALSPRGSSK